MKTEKTFAVFFLLALFLRVVNVPGSGILLILSVGALSIIYFPLSFYFFSDKKIKTQNIPLSIIGGMVISFTIIGILFKLMYWPGAMIQLTGGLVLMPFLLLITFLLFKKSKKIELTTYYKNYLKRNIFWTILCIVFYFISTKQLIQIEYRYNPELSNLKVNAFLNPNNIEYQQALENYYLSQDSLYLNGNISQH